MAPVVCFTGLSGCGKSTLALEVARQLRRRGIRVQVLDGDAVRATLSRDLGFSRADREEHLRRISFVAGLLATHDVAVLIAVIAPYRGIRSELRGAHENFLEVYVNAPLKICEARDPKGLYRQARAGSIPNFTGISDQYEPPLAPDVECRTDLETVEQSVARVLEAMDRPPLSDSACPKDCGPALRKFQERIMADTTILIEQAYSAFNKRDIDGTLALMTQDVSWPKASEGGRVVGKEEIRAYWTRQWGEFDPCVKPLAMTETGEGKIRVKVHQVVKSLQGDVLSDSEVLHVFTMNNGLIAAMDLGDETASTAGPSGAFAHRP